jgi:hypothetical protein
MGGNLHSEDGDQDMPINRISRHQWQESAPQPVAVMAPQGFVVCPTTILSGAAATGWTWHQEIFRIAYEVARASRAAASADYHHRLFSNWN